MVYFVCNRKPLSIQSKHKAAFQNAIISDFSKYMTLYPDLPLHNNLYTKVVYIYSKATDIDVDNMSKPLVDAFRNIIYPDDNIISHRICSKILLSEYSTIELNLDSLPEVVILELDRLLESGAEHILYFEVGQFNPNMVQIGEHHETSE